MSVVSDVPGSSGNTPGHRGYTRPEVERYSRNPYADPTQTRPEQPAPVTLERVGDFLELDFRRVFNWLRFGLVLAIILAVVGGALGGAYAILAKPRYTVSTDILIDPANLQVVNNDLYSQPGQVDTQVLTAGSKLRVLTSGNVLARVVDELKLADDLEFYDPSPRFSLSGLLGQGSKEKPDPKLAALEALERRVKTTADEKSFVATLMVSAENSQKAIRISDALVRAFQDELARGEAEGASRAAAALAERLGQLKQDAQLAEEKVEDYKRKNNLSSTNGELVTAQTMTQLNSQIVVAQSNVIAAQAAYDALLAAGSNASSTDPAASMTLTGLRDKAHSLQQQLDALSMTYGSRHPTIVRLGAEVAAVNAQLKSELDRTLKTAKANLDKAKASLDALSSRMSDLKGRVFADNESQVALRELQRDATAKSAIYESFLSRTRQISEREQINTSNVRVISEPVPPPGRSWPPRTILMVALGAIAGFLLGLFVAMIKGASRDLRRPPVLVATTM